MTATTRWSARLTVVALATATIAAGALVTAAPAHADRAQECNEFLNKGLVYYRLYEWYGVAFGYDSPQAQAWLNTGIDAADDWMRDC